jgi:hypothetical protein
MIGQDVAVEEICCEPLSTWPFPVYIDLQGKTAAKLGPACKILQGRRSDRQSAGNVPSWA